MYYMICQQLIVILKISKCEEYMKLEQSSDLSQFKNLFSLFKKDNAHQHIEKQVTKLIESNMLSLVFEYTSSGYQLNKQQKKNLYQQLDNMHYSNRLSLFCDSLNKKIILSDELLLNYFGDFSESKKVYDRWIISAKIFQFEAKPFVEYTLERLPYLNLDSLYEKWINNVDKFYKIIKNPLTLNYYTSNGKFNEQLIKTVVEPIRQYGDYILKNRSLTEIVDYINKVEIMQQKIKNHKSFNYTNISTELSKTLVVLKQIPNTYYRTDIENNKKEISVLYSESQIDKIIAQENINFNKKNNINSLPKLAQEILEDMKNNYLQLNKRLDDLNEEDKFTLDNLWNKRIPEVINKYLRADPEFRQSMKNSNNQTIEDLLIDSLQNMQDRLHQINSLHNENVLNDMSAINRYTKAIKM